MEVYLLDEMYMHNSRDYNGIVSSDASSVLPLKALLTDLIHDGDSDAFSQLTTSQSWQTLNLPSYIIFISRHMGSDSRYLGHRGFVNSTSSQVMLMTQAYLVGTTVMGFSPFYFACFTLSLRFRLNLYVYKNALNYSGHSDLVYIFSIIIIWLLFYDIY